MMGILELLRTGAVASGNEEWKCALRRRFTGFFWLVVYVSHGLLYADVESQKDVSQYTRICVARLDANAKIP